MKEYKINQYPKFRPDSERKLNGYQIIVRNNQTKYVYDKTKSCSICGVEQDSIKEFYLKDGKTGRKSTYCRDCSLKKQGVLEIGKLRYSKTIASKGFRRCSVCKDTKPLTDFAKSKKRYMGISNNCKSCGFKKHKEFQDKQYEEITDWYVKEYGKEKGLSTFNKNIIDSLRIEIIKSREPKYFLDGESFVTISEFARYILSKYGILITTTEKRIYKGYSEEECKLSENEIRRSKSGTSLGKIKVTDVVTGQEWIFVNRSNKSIFKMFTQRTISEAIKTGELTKGSKRGLHPNPCKIEIYD